MRTTDDGETRVANAQCYEHGSVLSGQAEGNELGRNDGIFFLLEQPVQRDFYA
ncbi:hypothetical protein [Type-D symbiont of Plautia stali]|uniref:hypothetical protein n=1 Tax=Type-D symbiont of Plautia stali TaxID=1560356 RepID=UPI0014289E07|nr:hypothetical protein [Type-D symbiont of Plautia stali]